MHFRDQKYRNFQKNAYIIVRKHTSFCKKNSFGELDPPVQAEETSRIGISLVMRRAMR